MDSKLAAWQLELAHAENARLRQEIESLRSENKGLRAQLDRETNAESVDLQETAEKSGKEVDAAARKLISLDSAAGRARIIFLTIAFFNVGSKNFGGEEAQRAAESEMRSDELGRWNPCCACQLLAQHEGLSICQHMTRHRSRSVSRPMSSSVSDSCSSESRTQSRQANLERTCLGISRLTKMPTAHIRTRRASVAHAMQVL